MPLPGSRVFHPRWSEHHRPTATAALTGTCVITRPDADNTDDAYDPGTLQFTQTQASTVYSGPCRVQALTADDTRQRFGEQDVTDADFRVVVEWDADPALNDVVTVTTADDPSLAGRRLRVVGITRGTEHWERDLACKDWLG